MSKIDDLIDDLPNEMQDLVRAHIKTVLAMEADRLQQWLLMIAGKHWNGAYQTLNDKLMPDEKLIEQDRLNALVQEYNKQNKVQIDMWRNFFFSLIAVAIQSTAGEIVS